MPFPFLLWGAGALGTAVVGWIGKMTWDYFDEKAEAERQEQERRRDRDRRAWAYYQAVVLLQGKTGAGKDTILHILEGKGFTEEYRGTAQHWIEEDISIGEGFTPQQWKLFNTAGRDDASQSKSKKRLSLLDSDEEIRNKQLKKLVWLYVFDMQKYDKDYIKADYDEAKAQGIAFRAVGTHLDKVSKEQVEQIEKELKEAKIPYYPYDMTQNPREELKEMILAAQGA